MMRISVVIVTGYHPPEHVQGAVDSLAAAQDESLHDVIIVETENKGPVDTTALSQRGVIVSFKQMFDKPFFDGVLHEAWNYGLSNTFGDIVFICNDDLVFGHRALEQCAMAAEAFKLWCVYPCHTSRELPANFHERAKALGSSPQPVLCGPPEFRGFCFGLTREAIDGIGPFDEQFKFWYGDTDTWYRLIMAGHPAREVATALVHHYEGAGTLTRKAPGYSEAFSQATGHDAFAFEKKWGVVNGQIVSGQDLLKLKGLA
jgi:GT2 family glycosyltransferase